MSEAPTWENRKLYVCGTCMDTGLTLTERRVNGLPYTFSNPCQRCYRGILQTRILEGWRKPKQKLDDEEQPKSRGFKQVADP